MEHDFSLLKEFLFKEMAPPEIIPPHDFGFNKKRNRDKHRHALLSNKRAQLVKNITPDINLYKSGNKFIVIDDNLDEMIYTVSYEIEDHNKLLGSGFAKQFMVWRSNLNPTITRRIPTDVFLNYILPLKGCMLTDSKQTDLGRYFWSNRVADAFSNPKYYVYYVDFGRRLLKELNNDSDLNKAIADYGIWGYGPQYQMQRLAITNKKLNEKDPYQRAMKGI